MLELNIEQSKKGKFIPVDYILILQMMKACLPIKSAFEIFVFNSIWTFSLSKL